jgi:hypothetical protein
VACVTTHPTPEERDERVRLPLPPEEALRALMETGPHPDEDVLDRAAQDERPQPKRKQ